LHSYALIIAEPEGAAALIAECPSGAKLGVNAGQIRVAPKAVDNPRGMQLRGSEAADPQTTDS
jgi:hypothetical protein